MVLCVTAARVQPRIKSNAARLAALTDLSVVHAPVPGRPCHTDLRSVALLTSLRTLSLEGCASLCATTDALSPLSRLSALALTGCEDKTELVGRLGAFLLKFSGLQLLNLDLDVRDLVRSWQRGDSGAVMPAAQSVVWAGMQLEAAARSLEAARTAEAAARRFAAQEHSFEAELRLHIAAQNVEAAQEVEAAARQEKVAVSVQALEADFRTGMSVALRKLPLLLGANTRFSTDPPVCAN